MKTCCFRNDNNLYLLLLLLVVTFATIPSTLCSVIKKWTPKLDATSTEEQREFYGQFKKILPYLDIRHYPENSVKVYIYGENDQKCTDNTKPLYFTWYSTTCKFSLSLLSVCLFIYFFSNKLIDKWRTAVAGTLALLFIRCRFSPYFKWF